MSFLNPKPDNPVKKYLEWNSTAKAFRYYDKETKENVIVELPIKFIVLEEFSTITGYNAKTKASFYSNEVSKLDKEILNVRTFKNGAFSIVGLYKDIKDKLNSEQCNFAKSVYAILYDATTYEIVNFKLHGSALGTWIEKKFNTDKYAVTVNRSEEGKVGSVIFEKPIFETGIELKPDIKEKLMPMAIELQTYLDSRKDAEVSKEIAEGEEVKETTDIETHTNGVSEEQHAQVSDDGSDLPF